MVGSRWALVVVFHWRVTYVPQGPHCHPARIFHMNITHIKNINTSTLGKHQHPRSSNAKKRIWSWHWPELQVLNWTRQALDLTYVFSPNLPVTPCEYVAYAQILCKCKCTKKTEKHLWHLLKQQTPFRSYPVARQFTSPSVLAISVLKHLQSHHFYCWCKPHIHPYPSWPQEWKQHSTSYKKFRFYPQFLWIPC